MILRSLPLVLDAAGDFADDRGIPAVCAGGLREFFEIPDGATAINLEFHDRPSKDRVRLEPIFCNCVLADGDLRAVFLSFRRIVAGYEVCYLEVKY